MTSVQPTKIDTSTCLIIDVRTPLEHKEMALQCAHHHIPLDQLDPAKLVQDLQLNKDQPIYMLCRSGKRASQAAEKLKQYGCTNVLVIEGGILACQAQGLGVRVKKVLSIERQVRIAAGVLVVTGVLLGFAVQPLFYLLSLLVGAGLIFAGITDWCGMGLLLAKAPWNRDSSTHCAASKRP